MSEVGALSICGRWTMAKLTASWRARRSNDAIGVLSGMVDAAHSQCARGRNVSSSSSRTCSSHCSRRIEEQSRDPGARGEDEDLELSRHSVTLSRSLFAIFQLPAVPRHPFGAAFVPNPLLASSSSSPFFLLVWRSTRFQWPPPQLVHGLGS